MVLAMNTTAPSKANEAEARLQDLKRLAKTKVEELRIMEKLDTIMDELTHQHPMVAFFWAVDTTFKDGAFKVTGHRGYKKVTYYGTVVYEARNENITVFKKDDVWLQKMEDAYSRACDKRSENYRPLRK